jgi:hypothetical protein
MTYDWEQTRVNEIKEKADALFVSITSLREQLALAKSELVGGPIKPLEPYPYRKLPSVRSYQTPEQAEEAYAEAFNNSAAVYERNVEASKHNLSIFERAKQYMMSLGLPEKEYVEVRRGKRDWKTADWLLSLQRLIPTTAACDMERAKQDGTRAIAEWRTEVERKAADAERQRKNAELAERRVRVVAAMAVKYGLSVDADEWDVLQAVLGKTKYLRLAYYLERNRGDWSEGPDLARTGLRGFAVETELDQAIYADISSHVNDWDGDGRVFRDCEWNYSRLYQLASSEAAEAVADCNALSEVGVGSDL